MTTHHVHIFEEGSAHIERHLAFRDYLCEHPGEVANYSRLKLDLAACFPHDMNAYIEGKSRLIQEIEQKALVWYQQEETASIDGCF